MSLSPIPYAPNEQIPGTQLIYLRESNRRSPAGKRMVWVRCMQHDNEFEVILSHLKDGHTRSCLQNEECSLSDFVPGSLYPGTGIMCVRVAGTRKGQTIVIVRCKHKDFEITLKSLKSGNTKRGCWKCGVASRADKLRKPLEKFISEMQMKWGDNYDYSKVVYKTTHTPVIVICHKIGRNGLEHGEWPTSPDNHRRRGCPQCAYDACGDRSRMTTEGFLEKVSQVWKDQYDLSKIEYRTASDWIFPICPKPGHGSGP